MLMGKPPGREPNPTPLPVPTPNEPGRLEPPPPKPLTPLPVPGLLRNEPPGGNDPELPKPPAAACSEPAPVGPPRLICGSEGTEGSDEPVPVPMLPPVEPTRERIFRSPSVGVNSATTAS